MDTPSIPIPPPEPAAALSEPARILNTFIAPSKTFNDLKRSPAWWGPIVVVILTSLLLAYTMDRQIGFDQISRNEIAKSSRAEQFEKLPPDQKAKNLSISASITKGFSYGIPVISLLVTLLVSSVLLGVFNLGASANVGFKTAWAIAWYGMLPWALHSLLAVASMFAGVDKEAFNINNQVGTNPAYFMDPMGNKFLYNLVMGLDVFAIWSIILLGIGFACNSKVKRSTAIALVAGTFVVYKIIFSGLASLG
jgi:hypothetical protein